MEKLHSGGRAYGFLSPTAYALARQERHGRPEPFPSPINEIPGGSIELWRLTIPRQMPFDFSLYSTFVRFKNFGCGFHINFQYR
jgi:hypothetical protein